MASNKQPTWAIPTQRSTDERIFKVLSRVKYHYFEDGTSMCGRYQQPADPEYEIESGEVLSRPDIACCICRKRWMRAFHITAQEESE